MSAKTCEAMYYEESKVGRPIWGTGDEKAIIKKYDNGWRRCSSKSEGEVTISGRLHLVCKEHKRQVILLLLRRNTALLEQIRWA